MPPVSSNVESQTMTNIVSDPCPSKATRTLHYWLTKRYSQIIILSELSEALTGNGDVLLALSADYIFCPKHNCTIGGIQAAFWREWLYIAAINVSLCDKRVASQATEKMLSRHNRK